MYAAAVTETRCYDPFSDLCNDPCYDPCKDPCYYLLIMIRVSYDPCYDYYILHTYYILLHTTTYYILHAHNNTAALAAPADP